MIDRPTQLYRGLSEAAKYRESSSSATRNALWRSGDEAADLLDLSQVAPAARREAGVEAFFLLWKVIARVELPDPSEIPDAPAGKVGDENVSGSVARVPEYLIEIGSGMAVVWAVWLTASWIAATVIASPRISAASLDAHLIRLAARAVGFLAVIVLIFRVANDVGIPVYGLVAGAEVGGLAIALAARSTLENFTGTLNLYADRPVRVGDSYRYGEDPSADWQRVGTVEEIGLRSTRIRGLDRTITTIPNAEFSNMHIVNLTKRDGMLLNTTLGLRYETTCDQLRFLLAELRELLHAHPKTIHTAGDPIRVRFAGFGDFSLNVAMRVYIKTSSFNEFLAIKEDILRRVMEGVERAGIGFAFPSRTLYHTRDGGLDDERRQEAEKQVREWASAQTLPFLRSSRSNPPCKAPRPIRSRQRGLRAYLEQVPERVELRVGTASSILVMTGTSGGNGERTAVPAPAALQ